MPQPTEAHKQIFELRFRPYLTTHGSTHYRRMLDVGGGGAGYALLYRTLAHRVCVADLNDFAETYAGSGVDFCVADVTEGLPFVAGTFDLVVSHSTFEHITDVLAAMREIDRVLTVGGHAFITVRPLYYSAQGFHRRDYGDWQHLLDPPDHARTSPPGWHLNGLTLAQLLSCVGRVGWRIHDFTPLFHPVQSPPQELRDQYPLVDLMALEFFGFFEKIRDLK